MLKAGSGAHLALRGAFGNRNPQCSMASSTPVDDGWLTPFSFSRHLGKIQVLVQTPTGEATFTLQYSGNWNLFCNIFKIFIHVYTLIKSTPLFPPFTPPRLLFLQLHVAFFLFLFFNSPPETSADASRTSHRAATPESRANTAVVHCRIQGFLTLLPPLNSLWLLLKNFLGYDLYGWLFPELNFLWGKSHLLGVHKKRVMVLFCFLNRKWTTKFYVSAQQILS